MMYGEVTEGETGRRRNGSPKFYKLLEEIAETHDKKSHDYTSNSNPSGNYHFAGQMASMFMHSPEDAGFFGRIAEKIYRLANLESGGKIPNNESIEDTERDIAVITCLWMADRRDRRAKLNPINMQVGDPEFIGGAVGKSAFMPDRPAAPNYDSILRTMLALNDSILNYLKETR